jgi:hypothetical protein
MFGSHEFSALIRELHGELRQKQTAPSGAVAGDARWHAEAHELALRRLPAPREFLDWAKRDRHWSFTLAEVMMRDSHSGPSELATRLMVAILEEMEEERQLHDDETAELESAPQRAAAAGGE